MSKSLQAEALCKLLFHGLYLFGCEQIIGICLIIHCEDFLNMVCVECPKDRGVYHIY